MRIETDSQHYTDIAEAIRDMNGTENTYYPEEMASAILAIPQETYDVYAPIIYSLEEREVGVWTDGKPLYQKTCIFTGSFDASTSPTVGNLNVSNAIFKNFTILARDGRDGACKSVAFAHPDIANNMGMFISSNGNIQLRGNANAGIFSEIIVTIQYTKTTDVPGSGTWGTDGVPMVHYDGTERIIGTWFGETLYQKTFVLTVPNTNGDYLFPNTAIPNWNFTVNVDWTINGRGPRTATPWVTQYTMYLDEFSANGLYFYFQGTANAGLPLHVTIQYTKTSS